MKNTNIRSLMASRMKLLSKWLFLSFLSLLFVSANANTTPDSLVQTYDLRTYNPVNFDLKDLVFVLRSEELTEEVKKLIATAEIKDVAFKFYWMFPGKVDIQVLGLPSGFERVKTNLKNMVLKRLDFIVPQKLGNLLRNYKMNISSRNKNGLVITAKDVTNIKDVNEIKLHFGNSGMLKKLETSSPAGYESFEKKMSTKSWSHNKWVLDELIVRSVSGLRKSTSTHKLNYEKVAGMGFVRSIDISTVSEVQYAVKNDKKSNKFETFQKLSFSEFKVNEGLARNYFRQQTKE